MSQLFGSYIILDNLSTASRQRASFFLNLTFRYSLITFIKTISFYTIYTKLGMQLVTSIFFHSHFHRSTDWPRYVQFQ